MFITPIQLVMALLVLTILLLLMLSKVYIRRLKHYTSPLLGDVEVWQRVNGEKYLTINKSVQGISIEKSSVKKSYWYFIAQKVLDHCKKRASPHILFLGLGANTSSLLISNKNPKIHQTIIEIEEIIIDACRRFFNLDELKNYTLVHSDIHELINKREDFNNKFDVIVVDVFSGEPPFVSLETNEPTFIEKLMRWAKKDALLIFNRHADTPHAQKIGQELYQHLLTLSSRVGLTSIKDPRGYENFVITVRV